MAYRKTSGRPGSTRMAMSGLMEEDPRSAKEVGEEMLSNIGRQVLNLIQAGGNRLDKMDRGYADAVYDRFGNGGSQTQAIINAGSNTGIMDILRQDAGGIPALMAAKYGGAAANIASRYALPAAGVTLAGKGLGDIIAGLSSDETEERY